MREKGRRKVCERLVGEVSWKGDLPADRSWSEGAVLTHERGYKEPRGYLGVDSNDGARGALRQISSPIATKGYNLVHALL